MSFEARFRAAIETGARAVTPRPLLSDARPKFQASHGEARRVYAARFLFEATLLGADLARAGARRIIVSAPRRESTGVYQLKIEVQP